jgi:hypothetical protein
MGRRCRGELTRARKSSSFRGGGDVSMCDVGTTTDEGLLTLADVSTAVASCP